MHRLTAFRKSRKISQREFAERIGVDQSIVSRLEARRTVPSLVLAMQIEDATEGFVPARYWVEKQREAAE